MCICIDIYSYACVCVQVSAPAALLDAALAALAARGFVNYFGLQRFGANAAAPTHEVCIYAHVHMQVDMNMPMHMPRTAATKG